MRITLTSIWIDTETLPGVQKGSVNGTVVFDKGLKIEFKEELLPEELIYIRDGLADLTERIRERVLRAIQEIGEQ